MKNANKNGLVYLPNTICFHTRFPLVALRVQNRIGISDVLSNQLRLYLESNSQIEPLILPMLIFCPRVPLLFM